MVTKNNKTELTKKVWVKPTVVTIGKEIILGAGGKGGADANTKKS